MSKLPITARGLLLLIVINILIRGAWLLYMHPPQALDFEWYFTHASQLAAGQGYHTGNLYTAYWPIGYPFFLSLIFRIMGPSVIAGLITNAVLSVGIVVLVYLMGLKLTGSERIGMFAALGYTILPSQIEWNSVLGSEELFTALLLLSLYIYLFTYRKGAWKVVLLSGFILGLACDVRPIPLLFPGVIWLYEVFVRRQPIRVATVRALLLFVGIAVAVSPVTIRNFIALHHFVLISTNGGVVLWQGTKTDSAYFWSWNPHMNPLLAAGRNEVVESAIGTHVFIQHVLQHPMWTVVHGVVKWMFLYLVDWNVVGVTFYMNSNPPVSSVVTVAMWFDTIVYWMWMVICVIGLWKGLREYTVSWKTIALPISYILYNTAIFAVFPAWDRFRYPMMPLYAICFGFGIFALVRKSPG